MTVYCVFYNENGGRFLERIFFKEADAESYVDVQGRYKLMYDIVDWTVD